MKLTLIYLLIVTFVLSIKGKYVPKAVQKIIEGNKVPEGMFPFVVSLEKAYTFMAKWNHFCGGTIISDKWILTAAHCLQRLDDEEADEITTIRVLAGVANRKDEDSKYRQMRVVSGIYPHEKFNKSLGLEYDVGLLKLGNPLVYNEYIQPAILPSDSDDCIHYGQAYAVGWGKSRWWAIRVVSQLQYNELSVATHTECRNLILQDPSIKSNNQTGLTEVICVETKENSNICAGDSGSPLVQKTLGGKLKVYGVASQALQFCAEYNYPSFYRSLCKYLNWVETTIKQFS